ncbi:MAG: hypothetical protein GY772_22955, partial [bacterium]|nr:hypothetical protein [bacterium]
MTLNKSHLVQLPPAKTEGDEEERAERHREREEDQEKYMEMERLGTKGDAFGREHERDRTRDRRSGSDAGSGFASAVAEPEDVIMVSSEGRSKTPDFSRSPTSEVSSAVVSQRQKCRRERADESPVRDRARAESPPQGSCAAARRPGEDAEAGPLAALVPAQEAAVGVVNAPADGSAAAGASGCDGSAAHPGTAPKARPKRTVTEVRPEEPKAPTVAPPPAPPPPTSCVPDVMDVDLEAQEIVEPTAPVSARDLAWEAVGREPARKVVLTAAKPQTSAASTTAPPTTAGRSTGADTPARTATPSRWSSGVVVQTAEQEVKMRWHELVPEPRPWVGNLGYGNSKGAPGAMSLLQAPLERLPP